MAHKDWLDSLESEVASGQITVQERDTPWFDLICRRFPVRASGICWERLPTTQYRQHSEPHLSVVAHENEIREFLSEFGVHAGLTLDSRCVVIGDNTTSVALEMKFHVLLEAITRLLAEPQSLYVIAKDGEWCFAFTFEEDMYYAKSLVTY